jgi:hypothetical protein
MDYTPKLIGSGTYGCVVKPPIKNNIIKIRKKYTNEEYDDVGKLFKTTKNAIKEAVNEYMTYKYSIENIKYYNKIAPKIKGYNIISEINNNDINNCIINFKNDNHIHQLIYENAGITFKNYPHNQLNFKNLIKMIKNFFIYFDYYVKAGKIHNDINNNNIMIKDDRIVLIDFGLEKDKKTIFDKKYSKFFNHDYIFYSPEFRLLYLRLEEHSKSVNVHFGFSNFKYLLMPSYGNFDIMSKNYILKEIDSLLNDFSTDYSKIDIFSIGVNLYLIRDKIIFDTTKEYDDYNYLIKKMIEPNHNKRFSISEIIKYAS